MSTAAQLEALKDEAGRLYHMRTPSEAADTLAKARCEMASLDTDARFSPNVYRILRWVHCLISQGAQAERDQSGRRPC